MRRTRIQIKRIAAIVLTICMVVGGITYYPKTRTAEASAPSYATEIKGYTNWTFSDVGVADVEAATSTDGLGEFELENTAFSGYVSFSAATKQGQGLAMDGDLVAPRLFIGSEDVGNEWWSSAALYKYIQFGLRYDDEDPTKCYLTCAMNMRDSVTAMGWSFQDKTINPGTEVLLQVAFDYVDHDDGGVENDLKLSVWIDGEPVSQVRELQNSYDTISADEIYCDNYVGENPMKGYVMLYGNTNTTYGARTTTAARSANIVPDVSDYKEWTFSTLGFEDDTIEATDKKQLYKGGDFPLEDSEFHGYVKFSAATDQFIPLTAGHCTAPLLSLGTVAGENFWECDEKLIKFGLRNYSDGKSYLSCGSGTYNWNFTEVPIEPDEEVHLRIAFDYVDKDRDNLENDLQLYIWVNGIFVSKAIEMENWNGVTWKDIYVPNYVDEASPMQGHAALWAQQGSVTARSAEVYIAPDEVELEEVTYDLADGASGYVVLGTGTLSVNGVETAAGTAITEVGDYLIERLENNVIYRKTVHIVDTSNSNQTKIPALSYDILGGDEVMPIIGHHLPYSQNYKKADGSTGTIQYATDKFYEMTRESGINLIAYTETDASSNLTAVKEQLRLAEKYNMGMFVQDDALRDMEEAEYWSRLSTYANYRSFLGVHVMDEPGFAGYYGGSDHIANSQGKVEGRTYEHASRILNKYANLTGYVNLLPRLDKLNTSGGDLETAYADYIWLSIHDNDGMHVKQLSYDRYPTQYDWTTDDEGNHLLVNSAGFYQNLADMRTAARNDYKLPFWTYIETGDYSDAEDKGKRQIEREELLWHVNTALAYGTKGIQYYTVAETDESADVGNDGAAEHGLFDAQGNKTKWYGYVQDANRQIAAIDHVLMKSTHAGVVAAGEGSYVANNAQLQMSSPSDYNLSSVATDDTTYGALTGVFLYYPDETNADDCYPAYYVVNSNPTACQTITLNFANATTYSVIQDAKVTYVDTASGTCSLTIPAGEGVLVVAGVDFTRTPNTTQVQYYEDIEPYRIDDVTGEKQYRAPEFKAENDYNEWTFSTANVGNASYTYTGATATKSGQGFYLDGTRFSGYVNFETATNTGLRDYAAPVIHFGAVDSAGESNPWTDQAILFGLQYDGEATYLNCATVGLEGEEALGVNYKFTDKEILPGTEIFLQVTFDYIDNDGDGQQDDLKMGVWIDGKQVSDGYICINNHSSETKIQQAYVLLHGGQDANGLVGTKMTVRSATHSKSAEDYIFAGWFTDEACTTPLSANVTTGGAYAKFVDADVMSIKVQINNYDTGVDPTAIRFVSTVDTLDYEKIGFDIRVNDKNDTTESTKVYEQLYGVLSEEIIKFAPTECSEFSQFFFAYTLWEIPKDDFDKPIIVNSYWTTYDGTKVYGDSISYSMDEVIKALSELKK